MTTNRIDPEYSPSAIEPRHSQRWKGTNEQYQRQKAEKNLKVIKIDPRSEEFDWARDAERFERLQNQNRFPGTTTNAPSWMTIKEQDVFGL
jgi:hypothetical protein